MRNAKLDFGIIVSKPTHELMSSALPPFTTRKPPLPKLQKTQPPGL